MHTHAPANAATILSPFRKENKVKWWVQQYWHQYQATAAPAARAPAAENKSYPHHELPIVASPSRLFPSSARFRWLFGFRSVWDRGRLIWYDMIWYDMICWYQEKRRAKRMFRYEWIDGLRCLSILGYYKWHYIDPRLILISGIALAITTPWVGCDFLWYNDDIYRLGKSLYHGTALHSTALCVAAQETTGILYSTSVTPFSYPAVFSSLLFLEPRTPTYPFSHLPTSFLYVN